MSQIPWETAPQLDQTGEMQRFLDDVLVVLKGFQVFAQGILIRAGSGTPEGVITANVGSLFVRTDGGALTTLYVKESGTGNTGWVAK